MSFLRRRSRVGRKGWKYRLVEMSGSGGWRGVHEPGFLYDMPIQPNEVESPRAGITYGLQSIDPSTLKFRKFLWIRKIVEGEAPKRVAAPSGIAAGEKYLRDTAERLSLLTDLFEKMGLKSGGGGGIDETLDALIRTKERMIKAGLVREPASTLDLEKAPSVVKSLGYMGDPSVERGLKSLESTAGSIAKTVGAGLREGLQQAPGQPPAKKKEPEVKMPELKLRAPPPAVITGDKVEEGDILPKEPVVEELVEVDKKTSKNDENGGEVIEKD